MRFFFFFDTTTMIIIGATTILILFVYGKFFKKDKLTEQMLAETQYDWGRKEVRKHNKKDLENLSKLFPKFNRKLFVGHYDKRGIITKRQILSIKKEEEPHNHEKHVMLKFVTPLLGLDLPIFNMLGKVEFFYITDDDIDYDNGKELHLKEKEMTQVFDVFVTVDSDLKLKKGKIEENVFKGSYEELTGRINNESAKIAQLDLRHTQELALTAKRAEELAKHLNRDPTLKPM